MLELISVLTPIIVAVVTVLGTIIVAKIDKIQKDIATTDSSISIGDFMGKLNKKVDSMIELDHERMLMQSQLAARVDQHEIEIQEIKNTITTTIG